MVGQAVLATLNISVGPTFVVGQLFFVSQPTMKVGTTSKSQWTMSGFGYADER